jgi:hypothetical protein
MTIYIKRFLPVLALAVFSIAACKKDKQPSEPHLQMKINGKVKTFSDLKLVEHTNANAPEGFVQIMASNESDALTMSYTYKKGQTSGTFDAPNGSLNFTIGNFHYGGVQELHITVSDQQLQSGGTGVLSTKGTFSGRIGTGSNVVEVTAGSFYVTN